MRKTKPRTIIVNKRVKDEVLIYINENKLKPENPLLQSYTSIRVGKQLGKQITRQAVNLILNGYGKKIGVLDLNPKMLRQTFIVNFTGSQRELAEVLGQAI